MRQLAAKQAQVLLGGDFRGHLYAVCGLASDEVAGESLCVCVMAFCWYVVLFSYMCIYVPAYVCVCCCVNVLVYAIRRIH